MILDWMKVSMLTEWQIGSATKLCLALGCALPQDEQDGVSSEICHRNRVWWTAYMLDRYVNIAKGFYPSLMSPDGYPQALDFRWV